MVHSWKYFFCSDNAWTLSPDQMEGGRPTGSGAPQANSPPRAAAIYIKFSTKITFLLPLSGCILKLILLRVYCHFTLECPRTRNKNLFLNIVLTVTKYMFHNYDNCKQHLTIASFILTVNYIRRLTSYCN